MHPTSAIRVTIVIGNPEEERLNFWVRLAWKYAKGNEKGEKRSVDALWKFQQLVAHGRLGIIIANRGYRRYLLDRIRSYISCRSNRFQLSFLSFFPHSGCSIFRPTGGGRKGGTNGVNRERKLAGFGFSTTAVAYSRQSSMDPLMLETWNWRISPGVPVLLPVDAGILVNRCRRTTRLWRCSAQIEECSLNLRMKANDWKNWYNIWRRKH